MDERPSRRHSHEDVETALMWAIDHDRNAFQEHRATAYSGPSEFVRRRADARLVEVWRRATGGSTHPDAPPAENPGDPVAGP